MSGVRDYFVAAVCCLILVCTLFPELAGTAIAKGVKSYAVEMAR